MFRVKDTLIHNLILAAAKQDTIDRRPNKNISDGNVVKKLLKAFRSCRAPFKLRNAVFEFTSLMGGDKLKLFKKLLDKLTDC